MATPVLLPKQGQSVESCLIVEWKKSPGDTVNAGEVLCEIETDKAAMEIESPADGTLLATFFEAGDVAPVQVNIAAIGAPGEDAESLRPAAATEPTAAESAAAQPAATQPGSDSSSSATADPALAPPAQPASDTAHDTEPVAAAPSTTPPRVSSAVSPRARRLADRLGVDLSHITGTGPGGRIIERDIPAQERAQQDIPAPQLSPVARAMVEEGGYRAPAQGSGPRGRVMTRDLQPVSPHPQATPTPDKPVEPEIDEDISARPLQGVRKRIAQRLRESLQESAQLTLNRTADARALQRLRALFKAADPATALAQISINDLILYAAAQTLLDFPTLNARFEAETIYEFGTVHLGFAVDTPRGLLVPVIRHAQTHTLRELAQATQQLGTACREGTIGADDMQGGTFTVTNLGSLGIESFTPILNPPQVAILGVGGIELKPVQGEAGVEFVPHVHLSLTIDHQIVDGAPGAHFLQAFAQRLAALDSELIFAGATGVQHARRTL